MSSVHKGYTDIRITYYVKKNDRDLFYVYIKLDDIDKIKTIKDVVNYGRAVSMRLLVDNVKDKLYFRIERGNVKSGKIYIV